VKEEEKQSVKLPNKNKIKKETPLCYLSIVYYLKNKKLIYLVFSGKLSQLYQYNFC